MRNERIRVHPIETSYAYNSPNDFRHKNPPPLVNEPIIVGRFYTMGASRRDEGGDRQQYIPLFLVGGLDRNHLWLVSRKSPTWVGANSRLLSHGFRFLFHGFRLG